MAKRLIIVVVILSCMLAGCNVQNIEYEDMADHVGLIEESEYGNVSLDFSLLNGADVRSFKTKAGKSYIFDYSYLIEEGNIKLQFIDSKDNIISEIKLSKDEYIKELNRLEADHVDKGIKISEFGRSVSIKSNDSRIKLVIIGESAKGNIHICW